MVKSYTFEEKNDFSKKGIDIVCKYLRSLKKTIDVKNVEDDPDYQKNDIDLVWVYKKGENKIMISVEVKTDNYATGNFWLETLSNEALGTPGCFVKSKAKYLFYYFTKWDSMYIIPLKKAVPWFKDNLDRFRESKTTTNVNGKYKHTTVGRLVPIETMMKEVEGIKLVKEVSKKVRGLPI
jgi:hypothetical protein